MIAVAAVLATACVADAVAIVVFLLRIVSIGTVVADITNTVSVSICLIVVVD